MRTPWQPFPSPDETDIAEWTARRSALTEQLKRLDDRIAEETALTAADEAKLQELTRTGGFAADDAALTLRQERDRAWQAHAGQLDGDSARVFETVLRKDDEATALRLARSQDLAQARGLSLSIAERNGKLSAFRQQHEATHAAIAALRSEISTAAIACGLPEDTKLNQLVAWLGRRLAALEIRNQLRAVQQDARLAVADENKAMERLTQALEGSGMAKDMPARLEDAIAFAERIIHDLQSAHRTHITAAEAVERVQTVLRTRTAAWSSADTEMAEWVARWQEAVGATWLAEAATPLSPQEIVPVLTILQDLDKLIQRKADLDHQIDGMRKDQLAFAATVRTLAERLAIAASDEPVTVAQTIRDRLAVAERQEALFRRLSDENDARTIERRALGRSRERHDAQKRGMLDLFESSSLLEVGAHLETVKARQRLRERIAEAEADLAARLGVGRADEAEMLLSAVDPNGLRLEMAALQSKLEQADRDGAELHAERRDAERRWPPSVAVMQQRISRKSAARCLRRSRSGQPLICRLRMGILAGETALRLYRERHRSAMMRRASAAFSVISGGDYEGLTTQAEKGEEFLIANAAGGGSETGTRSVQGHALPALSCLAHGRLSRDRGDAESLPFIADDIMETFDDGRAEHAFSLMADMAGVGQVIYLTHHQHLCDIARKACPDVTIHTL
ncbi:hypothetical protein LP421_10980 [Rhizobium sp. RCAM05350]|nr:hypothetical protein LP421_10980 [Rhizobium sp. RCAM05350]